MTRVRAFGGLTVAALCAFALVLTASLMTSSPAAGSAGSATVRSDAPGVPAADEGRSAGRQLRLRVLAEEPGREGVPRTPERAVGGAPFVVLPADTNADTTLVAGVVGQDGTGVAALPDPGSNVRRRVCVPAGGAGEGRSIWQCGAERAGTDVVTVAVPADVSGGEDR